MSELGSVGFGDLVDHRFAELSGWSPRRKVAARSVRQVGPYDADLGQVLPVTAEHFTEAEAERVARALADDLAAFMAKHPETAWSDGPYAAYTQGEVGRKYCWLGHAEEAGEGPHITIQTADPEGIVIKSEEELAPLLALRRAFPRTTTTVHGNLKQALEPGEDGYELEPGAAPVEDDVVIATKPDVDGA